jgi:hypothetical protein
MNKPVFPNQNIRRNAQDEGDGDEFDLGPYHRPHDRTMVVPADYTGRTSQNCTSWRIHRRNFTIACTVFTLGSLLILFSSGWSRELIAPGPLSSHHAPMAASEGGDRCAACHSADQGSLGNWIFAFFTGQTKPGPSQSELCMNCHEDSLAAQHAMCPHNVAPTELAKVTRRVNRAESEPGNSLHISHQEIDCSVCHQEHHGGDQLTTLTDAQCQTCHASSFDSFETGHPEFTNYPQQRRARIAFDHAAHFGRHFPEKGQSFDCALCHLPDGSQNVMQLAPFEQSCAQCHNDQILDSVADGMVLLSLPMLDMKAIEQAGFSVGNWPLSATGDFDGVIPAPMRVLLLADPTAKEILSARGSKFEFIDLDPENRQDVKQAVELTWAIKRLLGDLSAKGPLELKRRMELVLNTELPESELDQMITTLDPSVFLTTANAWLPSLQSELKQHLSQSQTDRASPQVFHDDAAPMSMPNVQRPKIILASSSPRTSAEEDGLLAENPLPKLMGIPSQAATVPKISSDLKPFTSAEDDSANQPGDSGRVNPTDVVDQQLAKSSYPANENSKALFDTLNRPSGWYRDDSKLQVSYRAAGHADPCLKAWIDFVARVPGIEAKPDLEPLVLEVLASTGIGQCQACHTVDRQADARLTVNWASQYRDPAIRGFTRFSHAPHLIHTELKDCKKCHELDPQRVNATSFQSFDFNQVVSNFRPIVKGDCISCHQSGRTNSSCMQCHHYHVETGNSGQPLDTLTSSHWADEITGSK